jgi:N,N'-diacetyllegionaminate synthase
VAVSYSSVSYSEEYNKNYFVPPAFCNNSRNFLNGEIHRMKTFIIAEAGVNHNGSENLAFKLVDAAVEAGADAVKFQTFTAEKVVVIDSEKADYQTKRVGEGSQFSMLKNLELSKAMHIRLIDYCSEKGIEFMSTPFDYEAADFLNSLGIKRFKIPSGEITNHPFIRYIASFDLPIILSTGMATLSEIKQAVEIISRTREVNGYDTPLEDILTILHCTSNYPAALKDVNMRAMTTISKVMKLPVGYSDHTNGILVSTSAVALGAKIIEKHFTLDKTMIGPDHAASLDPEELNEMVAQIRDVEIALGSKIKAPSISEEQMLKVARRGIKVSSDLRVGDIICESNIEILRPAVGISPQFYDDILGFRVARPIKAGSALEWTDVTNE